MTTWIGIVPALRAHHKGGEPGPGFAVLDEEGDLFGQGRLVLAADDSGHLRLDVELFARRLEPYRAANEVVLVLERHVRPPANCARPFAVGRDLGAIEGFAHGAGIALLSVRSEDWRERMIFDSHAKDPAGRALATARERWPVTLAESRCPTLAPAVAEAALLAAYARETRRAKAR